jgi:sulfur carrier protein ThiS
MEITVKDERKNSITKITLQGRSVADLLKQLKINPETVLVVRKEEVIIGELNNEDTVQILSVVSGG